MEPRKPKRNNSDKNLPKIIYKEDKKEKEQKEEVKITRKEHKSKTIIDKKIELPTGYKYCTHVEQNPEFCDYMEDCIFAMNNFNKESFRHLFCVFDGHGGDATAKLCVKRFPEIFRKCLLEHPFEYELALKKSFTSMDKEIEKMEAKEVGNTGTVVFINNKLLFCANVGDSSCCLIGKNTHEFITVEEIMRINFITINLYLVFVGK